MRCLKIEGYYEWGKSLNFEPPLDSLVCVAAIQLMMAEGIQMHTITVPPHYKFSFQAVPILY